MRFVECVGRVLQKRQDNIISLVHRRRSGEMPGTYSRRMGGVGHVSPCNSGSESSREYILVGYFPNPHTSGFIRISEKRGIIVQGRSVLVGILPGISVPGSSGNGVTTSSILGVVPLEYDIPSPVRLVFELREPAGQVFDPSQTADYTVFPVRIPVWQSNAFVHVGRDSAMTIGQK